MELYTRYVNVSSLLDIRDAAMCVLLTKLQVKHRLDGRNYAVKKVPLSQARIDRIRERGHNELDEVLKEIRTLARLDHPNIVRYFTGWVEWVDVAASNRYAQAAIIAQQGDAVPGAAINDDVAARRVITESSIDGTEVVFENSKSRSSIHSKQESTPRNIAGTGETAANSYHELSIGQPVESIGRDAYWFKL